jgi:hypothetical protein
VLPAGLAGAVTAALVGVVVVRRWRGARPVQVLGGPVTVGVLIAFGSLLAVTAVADPHAEPAAGDAPAVVDGASAEPGSAASNPPLEPREQRPGGGIGDLQGTIVLATGLGLLIAAAVFLARRSELREVERNAVYLRSDLRLEDDPDDPEPLDIAEALERSLVELLAHSDPRVAICAAYAALLAELAAIGVPRHPYEGPGEHIARCLSIHPMPPGSINELLHLFEIARFSELPITIADAAHARELLMAAVRAATGSPV